MELIQNVMNHKEDLLAIATSIVTICSVSLHLMKEPDEKSNKAYKLLYNAIHAIAINKKIPAKV